MDTINIPKGTQIKLRVAISSDAIVVTHIRIGEKVSTSSQYKFIRDLGTITESESRLTIGANFYTEKNIGPIMNATQVNFKIVFDDQTHELTVEKKKRAEDHFTAYAYVKLIKS